METVYGTPEEINVDGTRYIIQSEDHIDQVYFHVMKDVCVYCLKDKD